MRYLPVALVLLSGCSTLHSQVHQSVHVGDSKEHVEEVLGEPSGFKPIAEVPGAIAWQYQRRSDLCVVVIKEDHVLSTECGNNASYVHPLKVIGTVLGGDGTTPQPSNSSSGPMHCVSNSYGSSPTLYTQCQ